MKGIIIQGSSRSTGSTYKVAQVLKAQLGFEILNLCEKNIGHFDYEFRNQDDDFLPIIKEIAEKYEIIIFATPVYWYTMSGLMKNFFDRISDCLKIEKDTGRKLRGKSMAAISCSGDPNAVEGFFIPFQKSAAYLGMHYLGDIHTWLEEGKEINDEILKRIKNFGKNIQSS